MRVGLLRLRLPVVVVVVVATLVAGLGIVALVRTLRPTPLRPSEPAAQRYGFTTDGGAPWAPESGQVTIADESTDHGHVHRVTVGFRFRTESALDQLDGHALELRLTVQTVGPCAKGPASGWAANGPSAVGVHGLPNGAEPYLAVTEGQTCTETLVRIGSVDPGELAAGHTYTAVADVPAGSAPAVGATLTVARRSLSSCADKAAQRAQCVTGAVATGPETELLVSGNSGWAFRGTGCRRWFADATMSFPCLPDRRARIMTLGDSITAGAGGDHTWRYWAWQKLRDAGAPDWVGTNTETWSGDYAVPHDEWDSQHDAESGISAATIESRVPRLVATERPDVILIDLGTNDTHPLQGNTAEQAAATIDRIIAAAQALNPSVQILVAQPAGHHAAAAAVIAELAARLTVVAADRTTSDSLVSVVDLRTGWRRAIDTWDGTHPTEAGEYTIASRFVNALATRYAFGRQFGAVPTPSIPATPGSVKALAQSGSILVDWERVPQASEYRIYLRDVTAGVGFQLVGKGSRELAWGKQGLIPGHQYDYYVTAVSAGLESRPSPVGHLTAA